MMDTKMIDLDVLTENGKVHNLSGHDRGVAAREKFGLDQLDNSETPVEIRVPDHIYAVSPSFVQGLLAGSLTKFGRDRDAFLSRYTFATSDLIRRQIDRGISAILTNRDFSAI